MKFLLAAAVLICALVACGQEPPALEALIQSAEQGDATTQSDLGAMYSDGQGVSQDDAEAVDPTKRFHLFAQSLTATAGLSPGLRMPASILDRFLSIMDVTFGPRLRLCA